MKKILAAALAASALITAPSAQAMSKSTVTLISKATGNDVTMASNNKMGGAMTGSATAHFVLDTMKNTLCYTVTTKGIAGIKEAHIHIGAKGVDGNDVVPLLPSKFNKKAATCVKVAPKLLADIAMNPNMYYFNVHTAKYPDGAVRGQLAAGM